MRRAVLVAALVVAVLTGMPGCPGLASGSTARAAPGVDPRVFVIGDSVILGARDALVGRLAGWQVTFIAKESFFTWQGPAAIAAYHAGVGDISVVALGNNDGADPGLFAHQIDQVMAALGPVRKVLWVNLRQFRSWVPAANAQLVAATARYPNLEIVDWDARATPDPALVYADGLHLNPAGQAAMAALVGDRVDAAAAQLSAPPPTTPPTTVPPAAPARATAAGSSPASAATASVRSALHPLGASAPRALSTGRSGDEVALGAGPATAGTGAHDSTSDLALAVGAAVALLGVGLWWNRRVALQRRALRRATRHS
jgi:hypothetical protein